MIVQLPALLIVTSPLVASTLQFPADVYVGAWPELDVAVTIKGASPNVLLGSAANEIVCVAGEITSVPFAGDAT